MTDNNLTYRTADIAHELPRITAQLTRIGNLLEKLVGIIEADIAANANLEKPKHD